MWSCLTVIDPPCLDVPQPSRTVPRVMQARNARHPKKGAQYGIIVLVLKCDTIQSDDYSRPNVGLFPLVVTVCTARPTV